MTSISSLPSLAPLRLEDAPVSRADRVALGDNATDQVSQVTLNSIDHGTRLFKIRRDLDGAARTAAADLHWWIERSYANNEVKRHGARRAAWTIMTWQLMCQCELDMKLVVERMQAMLKTEFGWSQRL